MSYLDSQWLILKSLFVKTVVVDEDTKTLKKPEVKDVLPSINRTQAAERAENAVFVPGDLDLLSLTLIFKLV